MSIFEGSAVALVTPFSESGVNYTALASLLEFQIENGTDAILVCGTTGEPATMAVAERNKVIEFAVKQVNGRVPVIAGAGGNNTAVSLEASLFAEGAGADALLIVTPYYNKCSQEGLLRHYFAIADRVKTPIIVYNVPSRTGVNISPTTLERLAEHPNIQAVKEASGNISQIAKIASFVREDFDLYSGNDDQVVPLLSLGGKGVISVAANVIPAQMHDMCRAYLDGNVSVSAEIQLKYLKLINALFMDINPIPVKTALNLMGFDAGLLRLPLCSMDEAHIAELEATLAHYGLV